ncbi:hypothetical protein EXIGLDRAFT_719339 [Exidia glandulosa HHB12029]|uniref:Uncharacterized protein n=1 Tax=Exidia glandulosa HHB12029 TaxID=1314781 RepID=A0A166AFS7_EXIGL|nr:hypothetical protein EXIGLDRAFT_719339 [Exidia glandulosa HHB12029]
MNFSLPTATRVFALDLSSCVGLVLVRLLCDALRPRAPVHWHFLPHAPQNWEVALGFGEIQRQNSVNSANLSSSDVCGCGCRFQDAATLSRFDDFEDGEHGADTDVVRAQGLCTEQNEAVQASGEPDSVPRRRFTLSRTSTPRSTRSASAAPVMC